MTQTIVRIAEMSGETEITPMPGSQKKLICTPDRNRIPPATIWPANFAGGDRSRWSSATPRTSTTKPPSRRPKTSLKRNASRRSASVSAMTNATTRPM
jgi:hypothetical protein